MWTLNPEILLSRWRKKIEPSSLSWIIPKMATEGNIIFMAHALSPLFPWGVLSTKVNPDMFRIGEDGQTPFEYATCWWEYFWIRKEKCLGYVCMDGALIGHLSLLRFCYWKLNYFRLSLMHTADLWERYVPLIWSNWYWSSSRCCERSFYVSAAILWNSQPDQLQLVAIVQKRFQ